MKKPEVWNPFEPPAEPRASSESIVRRPINADASQSLVRAYLWLAVGFALLLIPIVNLFAPFRGVAEANRAVELRPGVASFVAVMLTAVALLAAVSINLICLIGAVILIATR
jgi:hypothetical protein